MPAVAVRYRFAAALLALALAGAHAGPLLSHACGHYAAMADFVVTDAGAMGHEAPADAPMSDCCEDRCPMRAPADSPSEGTPEAPWQGDARCCSPAPLAAVSAATAAPEVPRTEAAPLTAVLPAAAWRPLAPPSQDALDTGPPPLPVRSHLAVSVLLI